MQAVHETRERTHRGHVGSMRSLVSSLALGARRLWWCRYGPILGIRVSNAQHSHTAPSGRGTRLSRNVLALAESGATRARATPIRTRNSPEAAAVAHHASRSRTQQCVWCSSASPGETLLKQQTFVLEQVNASSRPSRTECVLPQRGPWHGARRRQRCPRPPRCTRGPCTADRLRGARR